MQEININKEQTNQVPIQGRTLTHVDKVEMLWNQANNIIKKDFPKIPRKMKVSKRRAKKGFIGVQYIHENGNTSFERCKISDSTFKTKDGLLHTTDGRELLLWDGKFPYVVQEAKSNNPKNFTFNEGENETYGQSYIRAKMLQEAVKPKGGGMGSWVIWGVVIIALIWGASKFFGAKAAVGA